MSDVHVGCSGFSYPHWKGVFYPEELPGSRWLEHYAGRFGTVELNVTFYRLPARETFVKWHKETPAGFVFSLKGSRFITHVKRLKQSEEPLSRFMKAAGALREKLGVVLWQFPPKFAMDAGRLGKFLKALRPYKIRNTFEFRDETWMDKEIAGLLKEEGYAFCMADWPVFLDDLPITAGFVYIRRHGLRGNYSSCYSASELKADAARIKGHLKQGRDVFVYFNNDAFGNAPKNALELKEMLRK